MKAELIINGESILLMNTELHTIKDIEAIHKIDGSDQVYEVIVDQLDYFKDKLKNIIKEELDTVNISDDVSIMINMMKNKDSVEDIQTHCDKMNKQETERAKKLKTELEKSS